jgi:arsenate reductase
MKVWFNPACTTCQKTENYLNECSIDFEKREYLQDNPTEKEIRELLKTLGIIPMGLIRTKDKVFKEKFYGKHLSNDEWIKAMAENPSIIERPVIIHNGKAVIGRPIEKVIEFVKQSKK